MVVDRIEGEFAVIEYDGQTMDVPLAMLPEGVSEGDILRLVVHSEADRTRDAQERLARLKAKDTLPDHVEL